METIIIIPRIDNWNEDTAILNHPAWTSLQDTKGNTVKPIIRCNCGRWFNIKAHHLHPDGTVTASFFDTDLINDKKEIIHKGCGWHVFIKLEEWTGQEFLPEK